MKLFTSAANSFCCTRWLLSAIVTFILLGTSPVSNAQYCTTLDFALSIEPICYVEFAGISNTSCSALECDGPLVDYTGLAPAMVDPGESYPITVTGNTGGSWTNRITVFFDWDQNGTFEHAVELGSFTGETCPAGAGISGTVDVPLDAIPGITRMRVVKNFSTSPLDPCASYNYGQGEDYSVQVAALTECSEIPAPGMTLASANLVCGENVTLSMENLVSGGGISYQWQSSPDGIVWNNGPTTSSWTTTQSADTWYQVVVTCDGVGSGTSTPVLVEQDTPANCMCTPTYTFGKTSGDLISNVEIIGTTLANNTGNAPVNPAYTYFTGQPNYTGDLQAGESYEIVIGVGTFSGQNIAVWIDFNEDGVFSTPSERVGYTTTSIAANGTGSFILTLPCDPVPGVKRMRVRDVWNTTAINIDPCIIYGFGETEDYDVNILPPDPCPMPSGLAVASVNSTEAEITWNQGCEETAWDLHVTEVGGGEPAGAPSNPGATPGTLILSNGEVSMDVFVRADCGVDGVSDWLGPFTVFFPPVNDFCEDVTPVAMTPGVPHQFEGHTVGATTTGDGGFTAYPTVWHAIEITGECNTVTVDYCGNDPAFGNVWINLGTACPANTWLSPGAYDNTSCGDGNYTLEFAGVLPGIYYIPVMGFAATFNEEGPYTVNVLVEEDCFMPTDECQEGFSASPNAFITNTSTTTSTITVAPQAGGSYITDLDIAINITHTYVNDVSISLTSPCGTTVMLLDAWCADQDNFRPYFDDESGIDNVDWCAQRFGPVIPHELLSAFDNELIEGDWTLEVNDAFGGDDGTLVQWCLVPTLEQICVAPTTEVIDFTDQSITIDLVDGGECMDSGNYDTFDLVWTGGSANGVTLPYEVTGLNPGTLYIIDVVANCVIGGSSISSAVSATTMNCAPEEVCTYELTLSNSSGTGWEGAIARINNGWTEIDYVMDPDLETQSWTVYSCPGNPISLEIVNGGNGALPNNLSVTLLNADEVQVFFETGPEETVLYSQADGCPDCASAINVQFSRLAADLVEVNWTNIELPGSVDDIQVLVLIADFFGSTEIGNATVPAGSTSASVVLDGSYPFEEVTVQVITNCADDGGAAIAEVFTILPGCDAADQCEYQFNMASAGDGWGSYGLEALIDGSVSIPVYLVTGLTGTQSVFTCEGSSISVEASSTGSTTGCTEENPDGVSPWPTATFTPTCVGTAQSTGSGISYTGEYSHVGVVTGNAYEFTTSNGSYFVTITDGNGVVLAAGAEPLEWTSGITGTVRYWTHLTSECTYSNTTHTRLVACFGPAETGGCSTASFELILNPATDNVSMVSETTFCSIEDGDIVYSGTTCPSCFPAIDVTTTDVSHVGADISWNSNNAAGTDYTIYVGLPGFTPGVDEVASSSGTTAASGAQGPVNISGLADNTTFEVVVIEDCSGEPADASTPVEFTTLIAGDFCASAHQLTLQPGGGCPLGQTTNSFAGLSYSGEEISCIDFTIAPTPIDVFYTFNSGEYDAVTLYVSLELAAYVVVDIYEECTGNAIFCENGYASPQNISVTPFTDYTVRIITAPTNNGNHSICVSPPSGCTDEDALNYDPEALFDDGTCYSCEDAETLTVQANGDCPANELQFTTIGSDNDLGNFVPCLGATVPFVDEFYTFNSGTSTGVEITVTLGTMGSSYIELYKECSGDLLYCSNITSSTTLGPFGVEPNTNYSFRISTSEGAAGTYGLCVQDATPPPGCIDPEAVNYNPLAGVDDGSCIYCAPEENEVVLTMGDSYGDGWNGGTYTIISHVDPFNPVEIASGDISSAAETLTGGSGGGINFGRDFFCLEDGCYEIVLTSGTFPTEITWSLSGVDGGTVSGGAGTSVNFTINGVCEVIGCTNPEAINYNPEATLDDGSCIACAPEENSVVLEMADSFGDGWNGAIYTINSLAVPLNPVEVATGDISSAFETSTGGTGGGINFGVDYLCLEDGCYEIILTTGTFPGEVSWTLSGVDDGPVSGGAGVTVQFTINGVCEVVGCTVPEAINYNPDATLDDGSCIIPDCEDAPTPMVYCYGNGENSSFLFAPSTPGENILLSFLQGTIESSSWDNFVIYDGSDDTAPILMQNPAATSQLDGLMLASTLGNGLYITITSDGSGSCQTSTTYNEMIFDVYCGYLVVPGCTDPSASNYDPLANTDDGSCVYPPANNDCEDAAALTPVQYPATANVLGTLSGASTSGSSACAGTNGPDVFYTFNVPMDNHYWVNLNPFGGFNGVVEVLDACDGTVVACESAPPSAPFCNEGQTYPTPGFEDVPGCENAVCMIDSYCCATSWDGACASIAATQPECVSCLNSAPAGSGPVSIFLQNLPAGDYIVRVRDYYGASYTSSTGNFLLNVQYFPTAGVQDNPNNFLYACNQGGFQLEDFVGATPQSGQGALDYEWLIAEQGAVNNWTWQRGEPNYSTRIEWLDMEYGKTYNVYVRILMNIPNVGEVWGVYQINGADPNAPGAAECTISTASDVTPTEVRPNYSPTNVSGNPYSLCDFVVAYNVSESQSFHWRFDPDTDENNGNEIYYFSANPSVRLSWVPGLLPGAIYQVAVEVKVQDQWSGFSTVLPIELALPPNTVSIRPQFCNTQIAPNGYVMSQSACEADNYTFEFAPQGGGTPSTFTSGNYVAFLNNVNPSLSPGLYDVRVKVTQNGVAGDFGPVCVIEILGPDAPEAPGVDAMRSVAETTGATLYPNPNAGSEVRVELSGIGDGNHDVNIVMYDIYGKQISSDAFGHEGDRLNRLVRFDENLSMGMYMVHIFVDGEQFAVERLVVK